jgi:ABC-2 type transport system ATP-binding protein
VKQAVELAHIAKTYRVPTILPWKQARKAEALRDVTFHAPVRRISCLLGPNGAGKTTIIKILAGLIVPDCGKARILEQPLGKAGRGTERRIGVLTANDRSFYWRLTGRQNLDFFASLHGLQGRDRRRRVDEVLAEVDLDEDADKPFRMYSSGMKQKLLMARALLGRPEVLLLDEPASHLDPLARAAMHRFIRGNLISARKASVLLCTNDLSEAEALADHLVLLNRGVVLAEGSLAALRSRLQSSVNLALSFEKMPARNWHRRLKLRVLKDGDSELELQITDRSQVPGIVEEAISNGGRLAGCRIGEASLEEIFQQVTQGR